jgi:hypothetical protein
VTSDPSDLHGLGDAGASSTRFCYPKGRFDEIFFVDLPNAEEPRRSSPFISASGSRDPKLSDLDALAAASEGS